jgi:hypothetical protein
MSATPITRCVLFKIPKKEDQDTLFDFYRSLKRDATRDGHSYILSAQAGPTFDDERNQGYTVVRRFRRQLSRFLRSCKEQSGLANRKIRLP